MPLTDIIAGLFKPASDAFKAHADAQVAVAAQTTQVTVQKQAEDQALALENLKADEAWEAEAQKQSQWKDELWTLGFFGIFVASFIPVLQKYVAVGIDQLGAYPMWFRVLFCSVVLASFGIRFWRR
jgi:hypothetical protein